MTWIRISRDYDATPSEVWSTVEEVDTHVDWMADAELIRFVTEQTQGVGTKFECVTRIGPFRVTDHMEITEWDPPRVMGVRHSGLVNGTGRFTIAPLDGGARSRFTWEEDLSFPWWMGGAIGSAVGGRSVMKRIWVGNLERLRSLVERRR